MANDRENIQTILDGNIEAFQVLVEKYQRLVAHIVSRMVSNVTEREDLCQEVFLKVYQNLHQFRFQSKLSTWIGRIAYNTCINFYEKKKMPLIGDFDLAWETEYHASSGDSLPNLSAERNQTAGLLHVEIDKMPANFRTILTLFHLDGLSYSEIGKIMQLPEGTVKSHLFRARKHLKERLVKKYQPEEL